MGSKKNHFDKVLKAAAKEGGVVVDKVKNAIDNTQQAILNALDQDGNGQVDSTDIILIALKVPGIYCIRQRNLVHAIKEN